VYFFHLFEFAELTFCPFFMATFAGEGFLNKDLIIWLNGARLVKACIPASFLGSVPTQLHSILNPKSTFTSLKNWQNLVEPLFIYFLIYQR
jgi:hypothetical protein